LPRTRGPLVALLESRGLRLRRRDGQNFLVEPKVAEGIVADSGVTLRDAVIEIGPGAGALTVPLLAAAGRVTAIELDRGLADLLREHLGSCPQFRLHHGDALDGPGGLHPAILDELTAARSEGFDRVLVVANLPYSVGTELVIRMLSLVHPPDAMDVMLQSEVVARMTAAPDSDAYGPLAVLVALTAQTKVLRRVGASSFFPRPDVESVVVRVAPDATRRAAGDVVGAAALARRAFLQRRKTLARALDGVADRAALGRAGLDPSARAETIGPAGWLRLAEAVRSAGQGDARGGA
ncbi:MAG: 16S rRNA (adenine(1518)-N(6)/adenine(1519)-N(6))-dimethyltransferase RsmA, partial [Planctomycetes bacterium]|nr:16S rRNA (adenine(1518)-N(6)/adenine(1519)-N(6))-dimethyltransferase RsmA [Planctomycetota bacterium]